MLFCLRRHKPAVAIPGCKAPALPRRFSIWDFWNRAFVLRLPSLDVLVRRVVPVRARAERVRGRPNCPLALPSKSHPPATTGVICRPGRYALKRNREASRPKTLSRAPQDLPRPSNVPRGSNLRAKATNPGKTSVLVSLTRDWRLTSVDARASFPPQPRP